jgi:hypothetical protein
MGVGGWEARSKHAPLQSIYRGCWEEVAAGRRTWDIRVRAADCEQNAHVVESKKVVCVERGDC